LEGILRYVKDEKGIEPRTKEDDTVENLGKSLKKLKKRGNMDYRILEPGWAGELDDEQLAYIRNALHNDSDLAYQWGFRRASKRFSDDMIRRIAARGDATHRMINAHLVKGQA
jgi:hypothetical protein